jgi:RHS repeat-associated protein
VFHFDFGYCIATEFAEIQDRRLKTYFGLTGIVVSGSVRELMNTSGAVVKYYTFEPFGQTLESGGTFNNSFMFTGQYFDSEIDEYYLRARQYDPHISRFTSRDPVFGEFQEPLSLHRYLYCGNEPINRIDPLGLYTVAVYDASNWREMFALRHASVLVTGDQTHVIAADDIQDVISELGTIAATHMHEEDNTLTDLYIYGHSVDNGHSVDIGMGGSEIGIRRQKIGEDILYRKGKYTSKQWEKITSFMQGSDGLGTVHLRGCWLAHGWRGKDYIKTLAEMGNVYVDAFDDYVELSRFSGRMGEYPNYWSVGILWRAVPMGGIQPMSEGGAEQTRPENRPW